MFLRIWIWGIVFAVLLALGIFAWIVIAGIWSIGTALSSDTQSYVVLNSRPLAGTVEFDLHYGKDVTGLSVLVVKDADENEIWRLSGSNSLKPAKIVFGVLPAGPPGYWKQEFPLDNKPPADIRGKSVKVEIDCGYNIAMGSGHQRSDGEFEIPK